MVIYWTAMEIIDGFLIIHRLLIFFRISIDIFPFIGKLLIY